MFYFFLFVYLFLYFCYIFSKFAAIENQNISEMI